MCGVVVSTPVQCFGVQGVYDFRPFPDFCGDAKCNNPTESWEWKMPYFICIYFLIFFIWLTYGSRVGSVVAFVISTVKAASRPAVGDSLHNLLALWPPACVPISFCVCQMCVPGGNPSCTRGTWALQSCRMCPGCIRACGQLVGEAGQETLGQLPPRGAAWE